MEENVVSRANLTASTVKLQTCVQKLESNDERTQRRPQSTGIQRTRRKQREDRCALLLSQGRYFRLHDRGLRTPRRAQEDQGQGCRRTRGQPRLGKVAREVCHEV